MQAERELNGSHTANGNYVWGAALTLAWKLLVEQIINEPIRVRSQNKDVLRIVNNFNNVQLTKHIISSDCYYSKAGFGNKTVRQINQQVKKKFPNKTTPPIQENLQDDSIISFAYFLKALKFQIAFQPKKMHFNGKEVKGFYAKSSEMKKQIFVHLFQDEGNFLIQLKTQSNDQILIFKSSKELTAEQVLSELNNTKFENSPMNPNDLFEMPKVNVNHRRDLKELIDVFLANEKFKQYYFAEIFEIINLQIDETGVKVQNQGVIKMLRMGIPHVNRRLVLDSSFWVIMRQPKQHPYFVGYITETGIEK